MRLPPESHGPLYPKPGAGKRSFRHHRRHSQDEEPPLVSPTSRIRNRDLNEQILAISEDPKTQRQVRLYSLSRLLRLGGSDFSLTNLATLCHRVSLICPVDCTNPLDHERYRDTKTAQKIITEAAAHFVPLLEGNPEKTRDLANIIWAAARVRITDRQLWTGLLELAADRIEFFSDVSRSELLHALGSRSFIASVPSATKLALALLKQLDRQSCDLSLTYLGGLLSFLGRISRSDDFAEAVISPKLRSALTSIHRSANHSDITRLYLGALRFGLKDASLLSAIRQVFFEDGANFLDFGQRLKLHSTIRKYEANPKNVLQSLADCPVVHSKETSPSQVVEGLRALARFGIRPKSFINSVDLYVAHDLNKINAKHCAMIIYSLGRLVTGQPHTFEALVRRFFDDRSTPIPNIYRVRLILGLAMARLEPHLRFAWTACARSFQAQTPNTAQLLQLERIRKSYNLPPLPLAPAILEQAKAGPVELPPPGIAREILEVSTCLREMQLPVRQGVPCLGSTVHVETRIDKGRTKVAIQIEPNENFINDNPEAGRRGEICIESALLCRSGYRLIRISVAEWASFKNKHQSLQNFLRQLERTPNGSQAPALARRPA